MNENLHKMYDELNNIKRSNETVHIQQSAPNAGQPLGPGSQVQGSQVQSQGAPGLQAPPPAKSPGQPPAKSPGQPPAKSPSELTASQRAAAQPPAKLSGQPAATAATAASRAAQPTNTNKPILPSGAHEIYTKVLSNEDLRLLHDELIILIDKALNPDKSGDMTFRKDLLDKFIQFSIKCELSRFHNTPNIDVVKYLSQAQNKITPNETKYLRTWATSIRAIINNNTEMTVSPTPYTKNNSSNALPKYDTKQIDKLQTDYDELIELLNGMNNSNKATIIDKLTNFTKFCEDNKFHPNGIVIEPYTRVIKDLQTEYQVPQKEYLLYYVKSLYRDTINRIMLGINV